MNCNLSLKSKSTERKKLQGVSLLWLSRMLYSLPGGTMTSPDTSFNDQSTSSSQDIKVMIKDFVEESSDITPLSDQQHAVIMSHQQNPSFVPAAIMPVASA